MAFAPAADRMRAAASTPRRSTTSPTARRLVLVPRREQLIIVGAQDATSRRPGSCSRWVRDRPCPGRVLSTRARAATRRRRALSRGPALCPRAACPAPSSCSSTRPISRYDAAWDVVGAFDVLEHVEDDEARSRGMFRLATRPGGGIIVTVPQHPSLWSAADDYAHHDAATGASSSSRSSRAPASRSRGHVVRVAAAARRCIWSRCAERRRGSGYDPTREHAHGAAWAAARAGCSTRSGWAISRGVNLPAGGSLLAGGPATVTHIPFNRAYRDRPRDALHARRGSQRAHISATAAYNARCREWLNERTGAHDSLLVHSCTAALEMARCCSTSARRRGDHAVVHVRLDRQRVRAARRDAGVRRHPRRHAQPRRERDRGGDHAAHPGDRRRPLRRRRLRDGRAPARSREAHGCWSIEDAAQGSARPTAAGRSAASATSATLSFHETKNVICGEGGALLINDAELVERAEIIREKGTNRSRFFRGEVDKYTWVDIGSSFLPSDIAAAFLWAQLEDADDDHRAAAARSGTRYHAAFADAGAAGGRAPPDRPGGLRAQRAHVLPAAARRRAARRASSRALAARRASTRSSTTCRCTPRPPGGATAALSASCR